MPIFELLRKFDGERLQDDIKAGRRRYRLTRLPAFLVLHVKRFTKNNFFLEKNPTIVNFPVRNLELRDIVPVPSGAPATYTLFFGVLGPAAHPLVLTPRDLEPRDIVLVPSGAPATYTLFFGV